MSATYITAWAIKRKGIPPLEQTDPFWRGTGFSLYVSRSGFRYQYSGIYNADLFATKDAANVIRERGERIVKVRVTIEEETK